VVLSVVTIILLIITFIILKNAPLENSYIWPWNAHQAAKALAIWLSVPLVISGINVLIRFPILLNVVVDVVILACIIPKLINFAVGIPNESQQWCIPNRYPGQLPIPPRDPKCLHWKSIITILMWIGSGLTLLVCIIYVVQLLLRAIAISKTKLWKTPLSGFLPRQIDIHFSIRVLRQEEESAEGSGHGPVYLS